LPQINYEIRGSLWISISDLTRTARKQLQSQGYWQPKTIEGAKEILLSGRRQPPKTDDRKTRPVRTKPSVSNGKKAKKISRESIGTLLVTRRSWLEARLRGAAGGRDEKTYSKYATGIQVKQYPSRRQHKQIRRSSLVSRGTVLTCKSLIHKGL